MKKDTEIKKQVARLQGRSRSKQIRPRATVFADKTKYDRNKEKNRLRRYIKKI